MWDEEDYFNHESILIITEKGKLKRLKTPFEVKSVATMDDLKENEIYFVDAVITNSQDIMVYAIGWQSYHYYLFIVL